MVHNFADHKPNTPTAAAPGVAHALAHGLDTQLDSERVRAAAATAVDPLERELCGYLEPLRAVGEQRPGERNDNVQAR